MQVSNPSTMTNKVKVLLIKLNRPKNQLALFHSFNFQAEIPDLSCLKLNKIRVKK